jgi:hypothetical protein
MNIHRESVNAFIVYHTDHLYVTYWINILNISDSVTQGDTNLQMFSSSLMPYLADWQSESWREIWDLFLAHVYISSHVWLAEETLSYPFELSCAWKHNRRFPRNSNSKDI